MLTKERHEEILSYLKSHRAATVTELAGILYVSEATIRRDLTELQKLGLLDRSHGGAILLEQAEEISIYVRMNENARQKEAVATKALRHIPDRAKTIFLDSSSTVLALAQRMNLSHHTVVTNNLQTALQLSRVTDINLIIPGGTIYPSGVSVTGSWTNELLRGFRFDLMLCSCGAITEAGAYETSLEQREIKRTAFRQSDVKILLADHSKLERNGAYLFESLSSFDKIVFDRLTEEERNQYKHLPVVV